MHWYRREGEESGPKETTGESFDGGNKDDSAQQKCSFVSIGRVLTFCIVECSYGIQCEWSYFPNLESSSLPEIGDSETAWHAIAAFPSEEQQPSLALGDGLVHESLRHTPPATRQYYDLGLNHTERVQE